MRFSGLFSRGAWGAECPGVRAPPCPGPLPPAAMLFFSFFLQRQGRNHGQQRGTGAGCVCGRQLARIRKRHLSDFAAPGPLGQGQADSVGAIPLERRGSVEHRGGTTSSSSSNDRTTVRDTLLLLAPSAIHRAVSSAHPGDASAQPRPSPPTSHPSPHALLSHLAWCITPTVSPLAGTPRQGRGAGGAPGGGFGGLNFGGMSPAMLVPLLPVLLMVFSQLLSLIPFLIRVRRDGPSKRCRMMASSCPLLSRFLPATGRTPMKMNPAHSGPVLRHPALCSTRLRPSHDLSLGHACARSLSPAHMHQNAYIVPFLLIVPSEYRRNLVIAILVMMVVGRMGP